MINKIHFQYGSEEIMINTSLIRHACLGTDEDNTLVLTIWYGDGLQDGANISFFGDTATRLWKMLKEESRELKKFTQLE